MEIEYMRRALELAKRGIGFVNPNPLVGAVLVKDGQILGEGYHQRYGGPHAEVNAVASATESLEGATAYVSSGTLLPLRKNAALRRFADSA